MAYGKKTGGKTKGYKAPHTLEAQELKKNLIAQYAASATEINKALIDKAKTGDVAAIRELHERAWGKANESIDITNKTLPTPILGGVTREKGT